MLDQKIKTFLALVEAGSFTQAADVLCLTQPAVSHQIRLLEEEYRIKIFYKAKKELKLTPEGEILLKYSRRCAAIAVNAEQALLDSRHSIKRLMIGMTPTAEEHLLPQVVAIYCTEHGRTHVSIVTGTQESIRSRLKAYELDMAVLGGMIADDDFVNVQLDTDYLSLVVSPENPLAGQDEVSLSQLKEEKLILRSSSAATRRQFEEYLRNNGETIRNFNVMMEIDNVPTIKELVSRNMGVTIISHSACLVEQLKGHLVSVPIAGVTEMMREINLVYRKNYNHPEVAEDIKQIYLDLKRSREEPD